MHGHAKIEVPENQISLLEIAQNEISVQFKEYGFKHINIDKEGLVSGKLNRDIKK